MTFVKALNDYVFQVEDIRNGQVDAVKSSRLKLHHNCGLDTEAIISPVL